MEPARLVLDWENRAFFRNVARVSSRSCNPLFSQALPAAKINACRTKGVLVRACTFILRISKGVPGRSAGEKEPCRILKVLENQEDIWLIGRQQPVAAAIVGFLKSVPCHTLGRYTMCHGTGVDSGRKEGSGFPGNKAEFFHLAVDGSAADAKEVGGLGFIPAGALQGPLQGQGFLLFAQILPGWQFSVFCMKFRWEVVYCNNVLVTTDKGMFQGIFKFPNIAGPLIVEKSFPGVR